MFNKILIANRGEIACRIIKSCQNMGISTVALYSEADKNALHVELADESYLIGPPPASESYLRQDAIVQACLETGAQAVHPGYGFLSERASFAQALDAAGIIFIGPPIRAIKAMGDKIESKRIADEAKVSIVPGSEGAVASAQEASKIAAEIGYPVMIKASAGGGGKGMRIAFDESELEEGFERAASEARSSFGDDRCFVEKFVVDPRHIEIQVLGDRHGNTIYLGERECSIQRRHQKVIEEAPSPFLDEASRKAMGEQAVALAKAVGYYSAGTVEFIVDQDKNFYFLEMNTRLQVEHPVTELVTGVDLVEQMIRIAAGEKLTIEQSDVTMTGWALEARVYAEEPSKGFLPAIGRLKTYIEPEGDGIRVDSGVVEGSEISMFYDPMIAKLCSYDETREGAIEKLQEAIDSFSIRGVGNNLQFANDVLAKKRFQDGKLTTGFIAEEYGDQFHGRELDDPDLYDLAIMAAIMRFQSDKRAWDISGQLISSSASNGIGERSYVVSTVGTHIKVTITGSSSDYFRVGVDEAEPIVVSAAWREGVPAIHAKIDGIQKTAQVHKFENGYRLVHRGADYTFIIRTPRAFVFAQRMPEKIAPDTSKQVISPMPGMILRVDVTEGQEVKAGSDLLVLEAMKMENVLKAERDGNIAKIFVEKGEAVSADQVLVEFS